MTLPAITYSSLLLTVQRKKTDLDKFNKLSTNLFEQLTERIERHLDAPQGAVSITSSASQASMGTQVIPEEKADFVVTLSLSNVQIPASVQARRNGERVEFYVRDEPPLKMSLYEVGAGQTETWHSTEDLATKIIGMFLDQVEKYQP